jgi:muramoyltetrapeptide carboxypeptidase LdcA involved in peptidoglycan recycling
MPKRLDNCCEGKISFESKQAANAHFSHLNDVSKKPVRCYKCPVCDKFHSGHESRNKTGLGKGLRIKKMR